MAIASGAKGIAGVLPARAAVQPRTDAKGYDCTASIPCGMAPEAAQPTIAVRGGGEALGATTTHCDGGLAWRPELYSRVYRRYNRTHRQQYEIVRLHVPAVRRQYPKFRSQF